MISTDFSKHPSGDTGCDCLDWCGDDPKVQRGNLPICSYGLARIARQKFEAAALRACEDMADPESEMAALRKDAERYRWLRHRDLDTINTGGVFAGITPQNLVINGTALDEAIDSARVGA